ncbi:lasso peptide isopeptide bond-forming cyclase [Peribacillus simplex]|uniref:asparagine synthase (glutamine-hydrolyzing) n=2 Tax=Peribacillus TaxID=2675229 RepID=A0AA90NYR3_9BACI|nr:MULTISPECIES: lasso peptide isopeptide bond-forming cyclase [Peribacillus]MDP1417459.1 lasso peptide isopeptide bond-forming cyclase [Peribacillus simplex]MDP1450114.1 lasso peptide isopeptide bond-forming cyclase [Peribacillus frigoritolerans]
MSAIIGICQINEEPVNFHHGHILMTALNKYPSDSIQTWHSEKIFLGCHAQWITPESVGEQLPFYNSERQCAITADAIIDNRDELFDKLDVSKVDRNSVTDSQLILLSYLKWGEDSPKYLIGDFAFMIWDLKKMKLFGARDFSGSRTLYYYQNTEKFAFSTVIKPLLNLPFVEKKLNEQWLAEYLAIPGMFESVDSNTTVYKYIRQVPPSHSISVVDGSVSLHRYSHLADVEKKHLKTDREYEEAFRNVLQEAVSARLRTHHKVGSHLSGGLDSGTVASFAATELRKGNKPLHTFSYVPVEGFIDWTHKSRMADERPFIQSTVQHVGNINDSYMSFENKNPYSEIDDWLETLEMPYKFFENTYWLSGIYEAAHQQGIGILLNGQRGNWTISWGPLLDHYVTLLKKVNWFRLYKELNQYSKNIGVTKTRILKAVRKKAFPFTDRKNQLSDQDQFPMLINPEFAKRTDVFNKLEEHGIDLTGTKIPSAYEVRENQFQNSYYWNITGTYGSKLSLRYSVWDRDPTNDLRVIRFCLSVPEEQYVRNGLDRALVRRSTKGYLPDKVRLNLRTRGVQGADGVHRMASQWNEFINELHQLSEDPHMAELLNMQIINDAIAKIKGEPNAEYAFDFEFRILMRSLILYRFMKKVGVIEGG